MSLREIMTRLKPGRKRASPDENGKIYAVWILILPLLMGFSAGSLTDAAIEFLLGMFGPEAGMQNEAVTGYHSEAQASSERRGFDEFLTSNPFGISARKSETPPPQPKKPEVAEKPKEPDTALDDITLRGTLPGIGAWLDVKNELKLVLVGKNVESYRLLSVNYGDIMLRRGNEKPVKKYIVYGPSPEAKKPAASPKASPNPPSKPSPEPPKQTGNIVAAGPNQEGQVPSEMVSNLVQNPFDELKRIRMRPNERAGGLEVQWIQNDSLLKRLGVQRGDVIKSVNGIPFTNMSDIANSINSLMNSERFDVEVTRGGENTALRYVVK